MNRTDRLYALGEELRRAGRHGRTAGQLARSFDVSSRTIKRDISALQQSGFPLWAQSGPGGGYVADEHASLPPVNFTPSQAVAIATALASEPSGPYCQDGRAALKKLVDVLGPSAQAAVREISERVWVRQGEALSTNTAAVRFIEEALNRHLVVTIHYRDAAGAVSERAVEPQLLARTNGHWYLAAWCRLREAPRWFRYDRIASAHLTAEASPRRDPAIFGTPPDDAASIETASNS